MKLTLFWLQKKWKSETPSDYRPINLTTSIYKLIAKVIAERLKTTLPETISEFQMAFVKGRQICDAILIANETIDYWRAEKINGYVIKLDIEKAFDKISWKFIDFMLMKKFFSPHWRKMIKACISSVQYFVLIIGKPRGKIVSSRGIRQGDPISPFIFVLAMDYLSWLLTDLENKGKIKGANIEDKINISHILFADDILIFIEDKDEYIASLRNILHLFESASCLNFNFNKSTIIPINVSASRVDQIAGSCGIK